MRRHVLDARFDPAVHVIIVTGAGERFFCAGADIKMLERADPYLKYDGAVTIGSVARAPACDSQP